MLRKIQGNNMWWWFRCARFTNFSPMLQNILFFLSLTVIAIALCPMLLVLRSVS